MIHGCNFYLNDHVEATIVIRSPVDTPNICNFLEGTMAYARYKATKDHVIRRSATADEWCNTLFAQADVRYRNGDPVESQVNYPESCVVMRIGDQCAVFYANEYRWRRIMYSAIDVKRPEIDTDKLVEFVLS